VTIGATPGVIGAEGCDNWWTEEAKGRARLWSKEEWNEGFRGEMRTEVVADIEHAY
jgi:hypothetical protein